MKKVALIAGAAGVALLLGGSMVLASVQAPPAAAACTIDPAAIPEDGMGGWSADQLANAAAIVDAGQDLGLNRQAQILGVMTAIGESSLRNITYGDAETSGVTNPDGSPTTSIGLFQQQSWWGSTADRMNPSKAATMFYSRLAAVEGWQDMEPSRAINRVQINADPDHYAPHEAAATKIVDALTGACAAPGNGEWIVPARGYVTDTFGSCDIDRPGSACHKGTDLATGDCGSPIWAASAGRVTFAGVQPFRGNTVWIDHGDGIETGYFHMEDGSLQVAEGQTVAPGTQLGTMGETGFSRGCHLHFELHTDGKPTNAEPFMEAAGATLPRR